MVSEDTPPKLLARVLGWKTVPLTEMVTASGWQMVSRGSVLVALRLRDCQCSSEDSIGCRSLNVLS